MGSLSLVLGITMASMAAAVPLPLVFESNLGQTDPQVRFMARSQGLSLFLLDDGGAVLSLPGAGETRHAVRMQLEGGELLPASEGVGAHGVARYYRGNDPARWLSGVPTWDRAYYAAVYPGIDLVYYANAKRLEFDFIVSPGADPAAIFLRFEGLKAKEGEKDLAVDGEGRLQLATPAGEVTLEAPRVYQDVDGERRMVEGRYQIAGTGKVRFAVGEYDASRPLVIDPVLVYSSFLGGSGESPWETVEELAVDANGNSFVTGYTFSPDFPLVNPAIATPPGGWDIYVAKISADGSHIVYSTFLGSSPSPGETGTERPGGIAVDAAGNAYVSGLTQGANFPVLNAAQPIYGGAADMFVTKFSPTGVLLYSTYLGGSSTDIPSFLWPSNLAVTPDGKAYVTGLTYSTDYPQVNGAQTSLSVDTDICVNTEIGAGTCADMVLTVLSAAGNQILYSTFWGGPEEDGTSNIAVDSTGAAYLFGFGNASTPLVNPYKPEPTAGDMFLMKIRPDGTPPVYATFVRTAANGGILDIDVDAEGAVYVIVQTVGDDVPVPHAIQSVYGGVGIAGGDWYLAKINPRGTGIDYATYLGGAGFDVPWDLEVDAMGNVAIGGYALYAPFPVLRPLYPGIVQDDGFVARIHPTGPTLLYSTPMGGGRVTGVGFNSRGDLFLGGYTESRTFQLVNPFQPVFGGGPGDAFVRRMADGFATLATPSRIPAQAGATISVPVLFTPGGFNISATSLSIDFDETCLTYNPADPIVYNLPAGYFKSVSFNAGDTDGEIDIALVDPAPPIVPLPLGELARLTFHVKPTCGGTAMSTLARVGFSSAPSVSFGASGQSRPGFSLDGSVEVLAGLRGDCNADQLVDAGDLDASVLEVFDTDGTHWLDARLSTFLGSPVGCDANADTLIDAADLSCTILLIFEGPEACDSESLATKSIGAADALPALELPARLQAERDGAVLVPVTLHRGESRVNSVVFSLIVPDSLSFDPTDANRDGVPDAVTFQLPEGFTGKVRWNPKNSAGQLALTVFDTSGLRKPLPLGHRLAVVRLTPKDGATPQEPVRFGTSPTPSFGLDEGKSVRGVTRLQGEGK